MSKEKLTRVRLGGFKSIRELDLELGDLTVLIGANGSGKTNLVQFFMMLNYMMSGQLQLFVSRKGGGPSLLHYGPKISRAMDVALEFRGPLGVSEYACSLSFAAPDGLLFTHEDARFQKPGASKRYDRHLGAGQKEASLIEAARASSDPVLRKVAQAFERRLNSVRVYHFHDTSDEARIRTRQDLRRGRYLMTEGGNLASFLHMLRERSPAHYQRILTTVRLVVPYVREFVLDPHPLQRGVGYGYQLSDGSGHGDPFMEPPNEILLRWTDRSGEEFGPHQLSDGSLRAIALITALLQPDELLPSVIVIDEPELGLHPGAAVLIGSLVRAAAAKTQVVVATQSPRLLAEFRPEDVVVVERREDELRRGYSTFVRLSADALGDWLNDYDLGALYEMNVTGGGPA